MDSFSLPLNKEYCDRINPKLYDFLIAINPNTKVLDIDAFTKSRGYRPDVTTIFIVSEGGSYDDDKIVVTNGSYTRYNGRYLCWESDEYQNLMKEKKENANENE